MTAAPFIPEQRRNSFMARVIQKGPDECWPWTGSTETSGHGSTVWVIDGRKQRFAAHRLAWEYANERQIPDGLYVMHSCDNPPCCNPAHLSLGTHVDNARDMFAKGRSANQRKTHCPHGHEYTAENTMLRHPERGVGRMCRTCTLPRRAVHARALRAAKKAAAS